MERIRTENGEVWIEADILMMKLSGRIVAEEIEEIAKIGLELTKKFKNVKYTLVDISGVRSVPFGARKVASSHFSGPAEKLAFVCENPVARIIGSFFLRRYKIPIPTKLFSNIEDAGKWFKENE
jgi:hypothetical protein